ncbi:hypothetical protein L0F63_006583, partial [Massospora cicadina]
MDTEMVAAALKLTFDRGSQGFDLIGGVKLGCVKLKPTLPLVGYEASNYQQLVTLETSFELPTQLAGGYGLKFLLSPHLHATYTTSEASPDPKGYYAGAWIPLCHLTLDLLHFSLVEDHPTVPRVAVKAYALEEIARSTLNSPYTLTHPFHADNLNAALLANHAAADPKAHEQATGSTSVQLQVERVATLPLTATPPQGFKSSEAFLHHLILGTSHPEPRHAIRLTVPGNLIGSRNTVEAVTFEIGDDISQANPGFWAVKVTANSYRVILQALSALNRRLTDPPYHYALETPGDDRLQLAWHRYVTSAGAGGGRPSEDLLGDGRHPRIIKATKLRIQLEIGSR